MRKSLIVVSLVLCGCDQTQLVPAYSVESALLCTAGTFSLEPVAPDVMLVVDRSQSMASTFGTSTRWQTLVSALSTVLPPVDAEVALGLYLFPSADGAQCSVSSTPTLYPQLNQVSTLLAALRTSPMAGGTPTADALQAAASHLSDERPRAMVLATDGMPNCNASCTAQRCVDDTRTLNTLAALAEDGVPTWVVGIGDDVSGTTLLDAMARAGGRPASGARSYVAGSSQTELEHAFVAIQRELASCTFTSPSVPDDGGAIVVTLDGETVPAEGWSWTSLARGELALHDVWCERAASMTQPTLTLLITCAATTETTQVVTQ